VKNRYHMRGYKCEGSSNSISVHPSSVGKFLISLEEFFMSAGTRWNWDTSCTYWRRRKENYDVVQHAKGFHW
jgi:hypothetical protein